MKNILILILAVCSTAIFGQKVSDYKYVYIPEKFGTFKKESYGLEAFLTKALTAKKYIVLPANKDQWPSEAKDNVCNVLNADVLDDSGLFTNKVILQFTDCNKAVLLESKGRSNIKEFEEGFSDALKQALTKVNVSNPVELLPAQTTSVAGTANTVQSQAPAAEVQASSAAPKASHYSNGKVELQKIQIDASQFILANSSSSVPFAVFKSSSKKDVFIVKLADGNVTIGYFENGNIVIDVPQADGRYSKEVFTGK